MPAVTLTDATFDAEVLKAAEPVLVDFWAAWCGPCRIQGPIVEKLSEEFAGKVKIGKLDVDANPANAQKYGVMSIPTIILYRGGQVVEQMVGLQTEQALREKLASLS